MKKIFNYSLLPLLVVFFNSCYYEAYPEYQMVDGEDEVEIPSEVSFKDDIQPLFGTCTSCHGGTVSPDLRTGNSYSALVPSYVTVNNANDSRLYNYLPGNGHHNVGVTLSPGEIELVAAWINQGAKNN